MNEPSTSPLMLAEAIAVVSTVQNLHQVVIHVKLEKLQPQKAENGRTLGTSSPRSGPLLL